MLTELPTIVLNLMELIKLLVYLILTTLIHHKWEALLIVLIIVHLIIRDSVLVMLNHKIPLLVCKKIKVVTLHRVTVIQPDSLIVPTLLLDNLKVTVTVLILQLAMVKQITKVIVQILVRVNHLAMDKLTIVHMETVNHRIIMRAIVKEAVAATIPTQLQPQIQ